MATTSFSFFMQETHMKRLRHLLITSSVLVLSSVYTTSTDAKIQCPEAPKQFSKTVTVETEGKASALGKLGAAELKNKTEVVAKDLLEKVPNQDRVLLGQTLISVYCQMLDQSTQLSDKEKLD